jgi:hypothetical protein
MARIYQRPQSTSIKIELGVFGSYGCSGGGGGNGNGNGNGNGGNNAGGNGIGWGWGRL